MERRIILAVVLMVIVAVLPGILFPRKKPVGQTGGQAVGDTAPEKAPAIPAAESLPARPPVRPTAALPAETVWVTSPRYRLGFSTRGAALVSAELRDYRSFAPGDSGRAVQLVPAGRPWLVYARTTGADTTPLSAWTFTPSARAVVVGPERGGGGGESGATLRFAAEQGGETMSVEYRFFPNEYRFSVAGRLEGFGAGGATLLLGMGDGLRSVEADSTDDFRHFAVVTKATKTQSTDFQSLKPADRRILDGPFEWAGVKSKYFFAAALAVEENQPRFGAAVVVGGERTATASSLFGRSTVATRAALALTLPVPPAGEFRYDLYAGPLEYRRLAQLGHDLDDANPYGGFLRPLIQPVSVWVVNILIWMHDRLSLAYGWVLIIFGVLVRALLWPLNQKAMESSIRMQAVAPLIKQTQDRYKSDPEKLQREMMRIYKENNVNPFGGCLPMLLPMPVLFALFFVFANTIEFRGVPFLWLPDLSRADPYYIIPIIMGLSMFVLSKVGQIGVPPNPQTKTMVYFMPAFMTLLFFRFASGLNIYYAVSNIFSIPQQYLIAMRRLREQGKKT
ncbi:MAG TPA: membrane protein insertase YidC [Gemmatimonadales bacterium]|nr:membrane protein insertase YidC [Gemmatimonadales bacterium]